MDFVLAPPPPPSVAIAETERRFAVRHIYCVGRNYTEHAREMGNDPDKEPPFFFSKPNDTLVDSGVKIPYPPQTKNLHFEGELVIAIGAGGRNINPDTALSHIFGYGAGNDLTRRDMQAEAKSRRRPWDLAKGFDHSAICGAIHPVEQIGHLSTGRLTTRVNGAIQQDGNIQDLIWPVPDVIAFLSQSVALKAGDLIYTGTPAGVGALQKGDHCVVEIEGLSKAEVLIG